MNEGKCWVSLQALGCKILYTRNVGDLFQEVEFRVSPATDMVKLLCTLREFDFYEMRFDATEKDVVIGSRVLY